MTLFQQIYIGMNVSRSTVLYINVLLIFNMHNLNSVLFLNENSFSALTLLFAAAAKEYCPFHDNICVTIITHI